MIFAGSFCCLHNKKKEEKKRCIFVKNNIRSKAKTSFFDSDIANMTTRKNVTKFFLALIFSSNKTIKNIVFCWQYIIVSLKTIYLIVL